MRLINFLKSLFHNTFVRYLFVGGINTCFGYAMFAFCVYIIK